MTTDPRPSGWTFHCERPACDVRLATPHEDFSGAFHFARGKGWRRENRCPDCERLERFKEHLRFLPPDEAAREKLIREANRRLGALHRGGHGEDGEPFYLVVGPPKPEARDGWALAIDAAVYGVLGEFPPAFSWSEMPVDAVDALREDSEPFDWLASSPSRHRYVSLAMSQESFPDLSDALEAGMREEAADRFAAFAMTVLGAALDREDGGA